MVKNLNLPPVELIQLSGGWKRPMAWFETPRKKKKKPREKP